MFAITRFRGEIVLECDNLALVNALVSEDEDPAVRGCHN